MDSITNITRAPRLESISPSPLLHNGMRQAQYFWKPFSPKPKRVNEIMASFVDVLVFEEGEASKNNASNIPAAQRHEDERNIAAYYLELSAP